MGTFDDAYVNNNSSDPIGMPSQKPTVSYQVLVEEHLPAIYQSLTGLFEESFLRSHVIFNIGELQGHPLGTSMRSHLHEKLGITPKVPVQVIIPIHPRGLIADDGFELVIEFGDLSITPPVESGAVWTSAYALYRTALRNRQNGELVTHQNVDQFLNHFDNLIDGLEPFSGDAGTLGR